MGGGGEKKRDFFVVDRVKEDNTEEWGGEIIQKLGRSFRLQKSKRGGRFLLPILQTEEGNTREACLAGYFMTNHNARKKGRPR